MARLGVPHRQPPDADRFYLDFLPLRRRTIQRSGITLFNITDSDGILSTFPTRPRQLFVVRYDPRDLSQSTCAIPMAPTGPFPTAIAGCPR